MNAPPSSTRPHGGAELGVAAAAGGVRGSNSGTAMARTTRYRGTLGRSMLATLLVLASVTDKLVEFATNVVGDLGLPGIFLLMVLESACIPIP